MQKRAHRHVYTVSGRVGGNEGGGATPANALHPKDDWINPEGGHLGRKKEVSDQKIFETVTLPWVVQMVEVKA